MNLLMICPLAPMIFPQKKWRIQCVHMNLTYSSHFNTINYILSDTVTLLVKLWNIAHLSILYSSMICDHIPHTDNTWWFSPMLTLKLPQGNTNSIPSIHINCQLYPIMLHHIIHYVWLVSYITMFFSCFHEKKHRLLGCCIP